MEAPETDVLKASELEDEIEAILHQHGIQDGWQYASALVESGVQPGPLNLMLSGVRGDVAEPALKRVSALVEINDLLANWRTAPPRSPIWCARLRSTRTWTRRQCRTST